MQMQLRLRTKLTLIMTSLVLLVVAVLCVVFLAQLLERELQETDQHAREIGHQLFLQAQNALTQAADRGLRPATSSDEDIHDYVRHALEINDGIAAQIDAALAIPYMYEISITDKDSM